jgi:hypothetical protein
MDNICNLLIMLVARVRIKFTTNGLGHLSSSLIPSYVFL